MECDLNGGQTEVWKLIQTSEAESNETRKTMVIGIIK